MSRLSVYTRPELARRLQKAYDEVKNLNKLLIQIRTSDDFRCRYGLDQESVNILFTDIKPPKIDSISMPSLKSAVRNSPVKKSSHPVPSEFISQNPPLRKHQKRCLEAIKKAISGGEKKGKIILPTGTGKTRLEACAIELLMQSSPTGIYVVLAPRILLTYQLLDVVGKTLSADGFQCEFLNVNSGEFDSGRIEKYLLKLGFDNPQKIESTTRIEEIQYSIIKAKKAKKPLVIFSTYHSVDRVATAVKNLQAKIKLYIYDEAQYCVTSGDFQETPYFPSAYKFFFTATEKHTDSDEGIGMNNESKFGKVIYTERPKQLIEQGEMASVAIHLIGAREEVDSNNYESKARVVIEAFEKHRDVVKQHSAILDTIGPKMLVVCDKQDSLKGIMRSALLKEYRAQHPEIKMFALSSDYGIHMEGIHKPKVTNRDKEYLFNKLSELEDTDEMILFHVDMVAEGMDVPGITGVLPFRNLGKIKFLQNLGRGTRLCGTDRGRLYGKEIAPRDWPTYVKPFCWVVLPVLSHEYYDFKRRCTNYIYALRSDYEFDASELVVVDNVKGACEDDVLDDITGNVAKKFHLGQDVISEILQEIEESEAMTEFMDHAFEFKKLTEQQQLHLIHDIFAEN